MATAVDSFRLLEQIIISRISFVNDTLVALGAYYVCTKLIHFTCSCYRITKVHVCSKLWPRNFPVEYGQWAIITNVSYGLGKAMAYELASKGLNILFLSKKDDINDINIAKEIELALKVHTKIIHLDYDENFPKVGSALNEICHLDIGILVNNVGTIHCYSEYFSNLDALQIIEFMHANIAFATMLTHLILPCMSRRKRGAIVMISSRCSLLNPYLTIDASSYCFLSCLTRTLSLEYAKNNINFLCLVPFHLSLAMDRKKSALSRINVWCPTTSTYARQSLSTLGFTTETTGYLPHSLYLLFTGFIPNCMRSCVNLQYNTCL